MTTSCWQCRRVPFYRGKFSRGNVALGGKENSCASGASGSSGAGFGSKWALGGFLQRRELIDLRVASAEAGKLAL